MDQAAKICAMSKDKADNVFFEKIPPGSEIQMPDQKNFVNFIDCGA